MRGRADMLFGATVFEFKSDLRREIGDVLARLPDYLAEREAAHRTPVSRIATDGASFLAFQLRNGTMIEIQRLDVDANDPEACSRGWSRHPPTATSCRPTPSHFGALGRESWIFGSARTGLEQLWAALRGHPEVGVKRELGTGSCARPTERRSATICCSCSTPTSRSSPRRSRPECSIFRPKMRMRSSRSGACPGRHLRCRRERLLRLGAARSAGAGTRRTRVARQVRASACVTSRPMS